VLILGGLLAVSGAQAPDDLAGAIARAAAEVQAGKDEPLDAAAAPAG
jgi:hypothetical protein